MRVWNGLRDVGTMAMGLALIVAAGCGGDSPVDAGGDNDPLPPPPPALDEEGAWLDLAPLPVSVVFGAIAGYQGDIWITGGVTDSAFHPSPTALVQRYDPVEDEWTRMNDLPEVRSRHTMTVFRDTLLLLGGQRSESGSAAAGDILAYDPVTDTWSHWGDLPLPVWDLHAYVVQDRLVVLDGNAFVFPPGDSITIYTDRDTWRYAPPPGDGFGLSVTSGVIGDRLYALTGVLGLQDLFSLDLATDTWGRVAAQPVTDLRTQGAAVDGRLHVLGDGQPAPKHRAYAPGGDAAWLTLTPPDRTLTGRMVVGLGGRLYAFGGYTLAGQVPQSDSRAYVPPP